MTPPSALPLPRPRTLLLVLAAGVTAVPGLRAQEPDTIPRDTSVFRIEGVKVLGRQPVTTGGGSSALELTVDSMGLPTAATVEDVLREIPALHLRTNSRGQAEVSVRGSESRQVAVLLDGVPLTLGWDARTDVSVLPATALQEVTFVRGLSTILHGPNVLGGVVEMSLARANRLPTERSQSVSVGADHEGGYGLTAAVSQPFETDGGQALVRAGAGYRDSPGFPLPGDVEEPVATSDDLRLNTDVENLDGFLALRYRSDEGAWGSFSAVTHRAERGIAAELGAEDPRFWRYPRISRTVLAVSGGTGDRATPWGRGDLEASVGLDVGRTEIRSYGSRAYDEVVGTEDGDDRTVTLRLLGDHTLGDDADLRTAATFADISHDEVVDGEARSFQQRLFSVGAETVFRLVEDPSGAVEALRLSVGGVWDRGTTPESGGLQPLGTIDAWGGRAGLSAVTRDGSTVYHLGLSRRGRFPALREAYSEALDRFVPNPDLGPEKLLAFEAGVTTRIGSGEIQVVGFRHELTDAIRRITFPDGRRQRVNSDELTSTGVELLLSQTFGDLEVGGDLTLQSVDLRDPENDLASEPENLPEQAGRAFASYRFDGDLTVGAEAEYTGSQFCQDPDTGEDVELDAGTWLNGSLTKLWRWGRGGFGRRVETRVSARNLADATLYDQCGLPRAGRVFQLQIRIF